MSINLLPPSFDELTKQAVHTFWHSRNSGVVNASQGEGRDAVLGGKNMDGFIELVRVVVAHCGLPADSVHVRKSKVVLPGCFRATKNWDVLVVHEKRLLGVFEFKSQVGSFGNNFNNRTEEVLRIFGLLITMAHTAALHGVETAYRNTHPQS